MNKDTGGAAFPVPGGPFNGNGDPINYPEAGMTLRDYFAAQVLAGVIASGDFLSPTGLFTGNGAPVMADAAYRLADAMLAERQK